MSDRIEPVPEDVHEPNHRESADWEQDELNDVELSELPLEDWGGGDLEAAYLKALSALEASESEMPQESERIATPPLSAPHDVLIVNESSGFETASKTETHAPVELEPSREINSSLYEAVPEEIAPVVPPVVEARPTPRQIIEACLFVGGSPLASTRLSGVLRGEFDSDYVDREINELNRLYAVENRPYEIRLGEGGYRLTLRDEFERIRHKVYGLGPKEVRLSQEALEVLAVVAYHQPIKQAIVEELGKPGCGPILRQLVRRELIAVARDPAHPKDVNYKTTERFLSLFGIRSLDELPRQEQVTYK